MTKPLKIYMIAGEASGDLHGSNLAKELFKQSPGIEMRCWGGDLMEQAGATLVKHYRDLAFMGFAEVLMNLRTIMKNLRFCKDDILAFQPDAIVLIDYPGFNLRIAEWAHQQGIKVYYYISPQIWAWKQNRVKKIREYVDRMFVVLPFEKEFYKRFDCDVDFVGHPLLDVVTNQQGQLNQDEFRKLHGLGDKPIIALLPGSRKQEISVMLPLMMSVVEEFPDFQFVIAGAPGQAESFYKPWMGNNKTSIIFGATYSLLRFATAGLVTSGTATLEAALFGMPQVVCYKGNSISYSIARRIIKVKYISLVNLILDRQAVKELIQHELNREQLLIELKRITQNPDSIAKMKADYLELNSSLGGPGASGKVATLVLKKLVEGQN